jgi:hypothetical protein
MPLAAVRVGMVFSLSQHDYTGLQRETDVLKLATLNKPTANSFARLSV